MKTYEPIIERRQPTCGGQMPTKCEIRTVSTDDPLAYVKKLEPHGELQTYTNDAGEFVVELDDVRGHGVKYIFSEE